MIVDVETYPSYAASGEVFGTMESIGTERMERDMGYRECTNYRYTASVPEYLEGHEGFLFLEWGFKIRHIYESPSDHTNEILYDIVRKQVVETSGSPELLWDFSPCDWVSKFTLFEKEYLESYEVIAVKLALKYQHIGTGKVLCASDSHKILCRPDYPHPILFDGSWSNYHFLPKEW